MNSARFDNSLIAGNLSVKNKYRITWSKDSIITPSLYDGRIGVRVKEATRFRNWIGKTRG